MYKRRDQNSFPVAAEEILRRLEERRWNGKEGGREGGERKREKELLRRWKGLCHRASFPRARRQMEDGENGARAKGCRDDYSSIGSENSESASRAPYRCILAAMLALI